MNQTLFRVIVVFLIILNAQTINAQSIKTDTSQKARADSVYKVLFNRRGKGVFAELGGQGAAYSLNYDTRFAKRINGFGGRIGISYYPGAHQKALILPILFNHLFGNRSHFLESSAGVILYHYRSDNYNRFFDSHISYQDSYLNLDTYYLEGQPYPQTKVSEYGALYSVTLGYRYQPIKGGVMFRVGAGPIFNAYRVLLWPYLSIGYTFKNKAKLNNKTK